jgi:uncharacterized phage infection (PIP) family protein YhgE
MDPASLFLAYQLYTSSFRESLEEDIHELLDEIQSLSESGLSFKANQYLDKMDGLANHIAQLKRRADQQKDGPALQKTFLEMQQTLEALKKQFKGFEYQASGEDMPFLRQTIGFGFPKLEGLLKDIDSGLKEFLKAMGQPGSEPLERVGPAGAKEAVDEDVLRQAFDKYQEQMDLLNNLQEELDSMADTGAQAKADKIATAAGDDPAIQQFVDLEERVASALALFEKPQMTAGEQRRIQSLSSQVTKILSRAEPAIAKYWQMLEQ